MNKTCTKCKEDRLIEMFPKSKSKKSGYGSRCNICQRAAINDWYQRNKESQRKKSRDYKKNNKFLIWSRNYGVSEELVKEVYESQEGLCAICEKKKRLNLDHCHSSGQLRGFLCTLCNTGLGALGDTEDSLKRAHEYLLRFESNK